MELLEREPQLQALRSLLAAVNEARRGRVVLVGGEAGIGKTSLVECFAQAERSAVRVLRGMCDALFTPRPLGPLYDIARQSYPDLLSLLDAGSAWLSVATAFLQVLQQSPGPIIVIVEDVHWADEATLDLLKYLGRRIDQTASLLILTYRDDELGAHHPLRRVLGELPASITTRLTLRGLSEGAVTRLAERARRPAAGIHAITNGNPFFVTEVLASEAPGVPATIRDAVLARAAHLTPAARRVLELAAVSPGMLEHWLLAAVLQPEASAIGECLQRGMLRADETGLVFHHELARRVVEETLSIADARALHAGIMHALRDRDAEGVALARLVHHAAHADDAAAVAELAPQAARQASISGAHREASAHYATALRYGMHLPPEARAELPEGRSFECYLTGAIDEAIEARKAALAIWQRLERDDRAGDDLRWLSRLCWFGGRREQAERYADEALAQLASLPPGPELAMAYSNRSQLYMLAEKTAAAREWGMRAAELAERLGATEILIHALTNIGTAAYKERASTGRATLERALALAQAHELHDHVARAYANLASNTVQMRDYARAAQYLEAGIAYTTARDLDSYSLYLYGWRARLLFEQGQWSAAADDAAIVLRAERGASVIPIPALIALGHLHARRGDPEANALLDAAQELALPTGELQRIGPLAAARAEAAWWQGDPERTRVEARAGYELALDGVDSWALGQLAFWLWRAGDLTDLPDRAARPYLDMIEGSWRAAADAWARLGCPFEQALALAEGDVAAQRAALAIFESLGAEPASTALRRRLRAAGVKGIPRGPRPETRATPYGLTTREQEVLALLAEGQSNPESAAALSITPKTVEHHVSAILGKLGARTRGEASRMARELAGLLATQSRGPSAPR